MHYLPTIEMCSTRELEAELKDFFIRLRHLKQQLRSEGSRLHLNRMQRNRCKENLFALERVERDFYALSHTDDIRHLYHKIHRYVKLDHQTLMEHFGREQVTQTSLFIAL